MADIKQAAKWMQAGHQVRRRSFASDMKCYIETAFPNSGNVLAWENHTFAFIAADLMADDWEIAPPESRPAGPP